MIYGDYRIEGNDYVSNQDDVVSCVDTSQERRLRNRELKFVSLFWYTGVGSTFPSSASFINRKSHKYHLLSQPEGGMSILPFKGFVSV